MIDIYALGSCRLRGPLVQLHRQGLINFTNITACWHVHGASECVQRLALTDGDLIFPEGLRPLVLDADSCAGQWDGEVPPVPEQAVALFEISTRRELWLDPYVLHGSCVAKTGFAEADERILSQADLAAHIQSLGRRFRHVSLVGNIALEADLARPNVWRRALNRDLARVAAATPGMSFVDPLDFTDPAAPEADLKDNNHFTPAFERRMALVYDTAIQAADSGEAFVPRPRPDPDRGHRSV